MKLLVIGGGMMGMAAAYDMARSPGVSEVTVADLDGRRARDSARQITSLLRLDGKRTLQANVGSVRLDASNRKAAEKLMKQHYAALSAVPYFFNVELAKAAIKAKCHFADLGGNNSVVRKEFALSKEAAKREVAIAPDCGLSPGMASILAGELVRRLAPSAGASSKSSSRPEIDALKLYVGGLPRDPKPPFYYQLVFSVEGLINEFV